MMILVAVLTLYLLLIALQGYADPWAGDPRLRFPAPNF